MGISEQDVIDNGRIRMIELMLFDIAEKGCPKKYVKFDFCDLGCGLSLRGEAWCWKKYYKEKSSFQLYILGGEHMSVEKINWTVERLNGLLARFKRKADLQFSVGCTAETLNRWLRGETISPAYQNKLDVVAHNVGYKGE